MFKNDCTSSGDIKEKLTITELRNYDGLKNISDEEAQEIIDGLYKLAMIGIKINKKN
ncbi:hypothetical protein MHTCC0001_21770 [Flavobacteriaceae bacterium MHTCC 0001]